MRFSGMFLLLALAFTANAQQSDTAKRNYLNSHHSKINYKSDTFPYVQCHDYRVVLFGELHRTESHKCFRQLFKSSWAGDSSVHLLMELSASDEYLLINYLHSGKKRILSGGRKTKIMSNRRKRDDFEPLRRILLLHDTIRPDRINCVDIERNFSISIFTLGLILDRSHTTLTESLLQLRDTANNYRSEQTNVELYGIVNHFISQFNNDSLKYKVHLSPNSFKFYSRIVRGLEIGLKWDRLNRARDSASKQNAAMLREDYMYRNITGLIMQFPNSHFVGEFGLTHVVSTQTEWSKFRNWTSLGEKLDTELVGGVCRIVNYYPNVESYTNEKIITQKDWLVFDKCLNKGTVVFDMREGKSLFNMKYDFVVVNR